MGDGPLVTIILASLGGAGGIAAVITSIASWRKGVREQDVTEDQTALQGYKDLAAEYKTDLAALKTEMRETQAANTERFSRIEAELSQERDMKWDAIRYIRRLHEWIADRIPAAGKIPPVPTSLEKHIPPPRD